MQNKKLIVLIVLGIVAIFSLIYGIVASPKTRRSPQTTESDIQAERKVSLTEKSFLTQRIAKRTKFTSWGRNPFLPKSVIPVASGLTGILWDKENPKVIINDQVVGIGDKVDGKTVIDIKQDKVILNDGTKDIELRLNQ